MTQRRLVGGDHIIINGGGGPDSLLVVYGDTSQDGVWYSGAARRSTAGSSGRRRTTPSRTSRTKTNSGSSRSPTRSTTSAATSSTHAILFAGVAAGAMPSVGLTIYGGAGNDTIYGSQAGDHIAGGSGDDLIFGQRGVDHIYGDSGVNVDVLTRRLTIPTANQSGLLARRSARRGGGTRSMAKAQAAQLGCPATTSTDIFGDHGAITQESPIRTCPARSRRRFRPRTASAVESLELGERRRRRDLRQRRRGRADRRRTAMTGSTAAPTGT